MQVKMVQVKENIMPVHKKPAFPKRYLMATMIFLGFCVLYGLRVNLNIAIGAMCSNHTVIENGVPVNRTPEFDWSSNLQGTVLGSFYYGYLILQIPGGWLAYKFGGTRIFGASIGIASFLTLITPAVARLNVYLLIVLRILEGLVLGVLFPCNHAIWAKWAPPYERSRLFTITVAGCPVGTIITMPISGMLTKYGFDGGWSSVFYVFGLFGLIWYFVWLITIHPTPDEHPTISEHEYEYIKSSIGEVDNQQSLAVPWLKILSSKAVWACTVANFCADWGMYTILICIPKYFIEILNFDVAKAGYITALPYIAKAIIGPTGGYLADWLIQYRMSIKNVRRLIFTIGCSVASVFIVAVGYAPNEYIGIAFLIIGVGITGLNATGYAVNILDIAPQYAGPIMGISNVFGAMPGFISPQIVGYIAQEKKAYQWQIIFWLTSLVYLFGIFYFGLTLSGDIQSWAQNEFSKRNNKTSDNNSEKSEDLEKYLKLT